MGHLSEVEFLNLVSKKPKFDGIKTLINDPFFFELPEGMDERDHSKILDKFLGFKIPSIEKKLLQKYRPYYNQSNQNKSNPFNNTQTWIGLHPQALQTPYSELLKIINVLVKYNPKFIIDLGAAYGRMGLVLHSVLPDCQFLGYEILENRSDEAQRVFRNLELDLCDMRSDDVLSEDFEIPKADVYFIYDFSEPEDVSQILKQLSQRAYNEKFMLAVRGVGARSLVQVKFPQFWIKHRPKHFAEMSLYSTFCDLV